MWWWSGTAAEKFGDRGKMVVVVLGYVHGEVEEPHLHLKTGIHGGSQPVGFVGGLELTDQVEPRRSEARENPGQGPPVMMSFVGVAVIDVGGMHRETPDGKILHPGKPQRLQIPEMSAVLLNGPSIPDPAGELLRT